MWMTISRAPQVPSQTRLIRVSSRPLMASWSSPNASSASRNSFCLSAMGPSRSGEVVVPLLPRETPERAVREKGQYHGSAMGRRVGGPRLPHAIVALLALLIVAGAHAQGQTGAAPPLLLMISIDGLRPDHVLAADARGGRIPNLRRFLTEGAHADGVVGVIPTTTYPSHATLVTGVWPAQHGLLANRTF